MPKKQIEKRSAPPPFSLEATRCNKGISVSISGIIGILDYKNEEVIFKTHGGKIRVSGEGLSLVIFENNSVEINGRVEEMGFDYAKA